MYPHWRCFGLCFEWGAVSRVWALWTCPSAGTWVLWESSCRFPRVLIRLNYDCTVEVFRRYATSPFQLYSVSPRCPPLHLIPPPGACGGRRQTLDPENLGGSLQSTSEKDTLYQPPPVPLCAASFPKIDQGGHVPSDPGDPSMLRETDPNQIKDQSLAHSLFSPVLFLPRSVGRSAPGWQPTTPSANPSVDPSGPAGGSPLVRP